MNRIHSPRTHGYSLIELLIYVAIFIVLSLVLVQSLVAAVKVYAASVGARALSTNGDLALDRMSREVRNAKSISGTFDANPSTVTLAGTDSNGAATTLTFFVASGQLMLNNNGSTNALTSSNVTVTSFIANHIVNSGSDAVRITLLLATASGTNQSATFEETVATRGK